MAKKQATKNSVQELLDAKKAIKLDLACGASKQDDTWVGLDVLDFPGVDIVHDIENVPMPLPDECCSVVLASHILEHINPAKGGFLDVMDDIWRVLKVDGQLVIAMPYGGSPGFWQDPTHCNGCNENTWRYFDPEDASGLYRFYRRKPWRIDWNNFFCNQYGNMELVLIKREDKDEYHA